MLNNSKIKAVIFDFDGIIVNTQVYHWVAWKKTLSKYGVALDETDNLVTRGADRRDVLLSLLKLHNIIWKESKIQKVLKEKNEFYKFLISDINKVELLPETFFLIKWLRKHGFKVGIATLSKNAILIIKKIEIEKYFDVIVDPETVLKVKPDPEVFFKAAALLGLNSWECLGIEDSQIGIDAINAAFMASLAIDYNNNIQDARLTISSTKELSPQLFLDFIKSYK